MLVYAAYKLEYVTMQVVMKDLDVVDYNLKAFLRKKKDYKF